MSAFQNIQTQVSSALGTLNVPGALATALTPNPGNTTTAVNALIVVNGQPQGLIKSFSVDETFNYQRVRAVGSAIAVALIPGVYEATASANKSFIFGQTLETAFGGGLRAVVGRYQADPDFTKFYFNVVIVDNLGNVLIVHHDCVLMSIRRAIEIDSVIIMEDASIGVRWTES